MPSPATLFEDERSLMRIMLDVYVVKSDLFGEMQTEAPVSMMSGGCVIVAEKHALCLSSRVK
jgi:hypothetical protein